MVELSTEASHELRSKSESLTSTVSQFKTQSASGLKAHPVEAERQAANSSFSTTRAKPAAPEAKDGLVKIDNAANDDVWMSF
jgi:hypothetical protein